MRELKRKEFANGVVYLLETFDGYPIEVTDTFLPYYTKDAVGRNQNALSDYNLGSREDRWMIGVSVMSGCPVGCKFCATGKLKRCRNLYAEEIFEQVLFVLEKRREFTPSAAKEFKINYTRMGEPFLNIDNVRKGMKKIDDYLFSVKVHHYISTIGIKGADYSWIKDNITLQLSVHSFNEDSRNWLIPFKKKVTVQELGKIRTKSNLKTTINLTMANEDDFDINEMKRIFDKDKFFVKISPINENDVSIANNMGSGIIKQQNLV